MQKIDAHIHCWKYDPVRYGWINDSMNVLQKDFIPDDVELEFEMNHIEGCVLVQSLQSEEDNYYMLELAGVHKDIKGVIGWLDLQADDIDERLDHYTAYKIIKGFRHNLQDEVQRDMMLYPPFRRGLSSLCRYGYSYDLLVYPDQLLYAAKLAADYPDLQFVLDHLGKPSIKNKEIKEWKSAIKELSALENVHCKVSGLVTEAEWKSWKYADLIPYLDTVVENFGVDRILFGSDWPVCLVAGSYKDITGVAEEYFSSFSKDEKSKIYRSNAIKVYKLEE
jgi:L-fuconolactonase